MIDRAEVIDYLRKGGFHLALRREMAQVYAECHGLDPTLLSNTKALLFMRPRELVSGDLKVLAKWDEEAFCWREVDPADYQLRMEVPQSS